MVNHPNLGGRQHWLLSLVVVTCVAAAAAGQTALPQPDGPAAAPMLKAAPLAEYDVIVEITNTTPEKKTAWPVIMSVYRLLGRDLPAGSVNPNGFHVYNEAGVEIPRALEVLPPYQQHDVAAGGLAAWPVVGNDELIFMIPQIDKGATLRYRVTNTAADSAKRVAIDLAGNPHNLLRNGGFEQSDGEAVAGWQGDGRPDTEVKRSGQASLRLRGTRRQNLSYGEKIQLHKGSRYYFGIWGKTDNVSRHGIHTSVGGQVTLSGFDNGWRGQVLDADNKPLTDEHGDPKADLPAEQRKKVEQSLAGQRAAWIFPQCYTRDWFKSTALIHGCTDWGLPQMCLIAAADSAELTAVLDQRPQFVRPANQPGTWWLDDAVLMEQPEIRVRFDELLKPEIADGLFLFTRPTNMHLGYCQPQNTAYCGMPYPREKAQRLERFALKGQRAVLLLGVYHTRPLGEVQVTVKDAALAGPVGQKLALTEVEYLPGYIGADRSHLLRTHDKPVSLKEKEGLPYFVLSFEVPREAKPGRYAGQVQLLADGQALRTLPAAIVVQDMELPIVRDVSVGPILQSDPLNDETMKICAKTGFNGVNVGGGIFRFANGPDGKRQVDLAELGKRIEWLKGYGVVAAVTLWGDADLGPQWGGGKLIKAVNHNEQDFKAQVKRVEEFCQKHPEWPRLIWMTWDEPQPSGSFGPRGHGRPCTTMAWVTDAVPNALTTVDAGFWVWDKILPYFSLPNLDEPADFVGPEVYEYTRKQGKQFGFAGSKNDLDERVRYQVGLMLIASGARNFQYWHLTVRDTLAARVDGKLLRSIHMVAMGEGIDDLRVHRLLQDAMKEAAGSSDPVRAAATRQAQEYLRRLHVTWNADHTHDESLPYLGLAADWGNDRFYQDWQEQMARLAAACKGVKWQE